MPRFDFASITRSLKTIFDSRRATVLCFAAAWANKVLNAVLFTSLSGDKALYLLFSQSMIAGKGPLEPIWFAGSGATAYFFNPAIISPLYSLLAFPVLALTHSPFAASVLIDALAWLSLLAALRCTAEALLEQRWSANLFVLCSGLFLYLFEFGSGPKDTLAAGFLTWSVYLVHRHRTGKARPLHSTLLVGALVAMAATKLLYTPMVIVVLACLPYRKQTTGATKLRSRSTAIAAITIAIGIAGLLIEFLMRQHHAPLSIYSHDRTGPAGIYPGNVLSTYPFVCSSLINTNFWGVQLADILKLSFQTVSRGFQVLDVLLFVLFCWALVRVWKRSTALRGIGGLLIIASAAMIVLILLPSIYTAPLSLARAHPWTFAQDARSFLFPMLSVQLLLFRFLFAENDWDPGLKRFLLLLFFIECGHGLYFTGKHLKESPGASAVQQLELRRQEAQQASGGHVVLLTTDEFLYRELRLAGKEVRLLPPHEVTGDTTRYLSISYPADSLQLRYLDNRQLLELEPQPPYLLHLIK